MPDMREPNDVPASHAATPLQISPRADLAQLLDLSPDAMIIVDQTGDIIMMNEQAEALFGFQRMELLGRPLETLLPQRFRACHSSHREHFFAAPRTRPMGAGLQLFGLRKDDSEFPVDISLKPLILGETPHALAAIRDVTQQWLAERERLMQAQHIRLQSELINQAHDAILVRDPIGRVLSWNRGAEHLYGWTEQEALGRITSVLLKTRCPINQAALDTVLEQEGQWEGELTHTCRDGRKVIVESRQVFMHDEAGQPLAILEINRDITERQRKAQAEQTIHAQTSGRLAFLQQVLDALPSSVYLVHGPDARLILANRATNRIWGASWQEEQPMPEFLAQNGIEISNAQGRALPPEQLATLQALQKGESVLQYQETIRHPDGSNLPVLVNAVLLSPTRRENNEQEILTEEPVALVVHQDVTALKEAEDLKDEFVGIAAHELRTPLAVLSGYADMLLTQTRRGHGSPLVAWQQEALSEIKQATTRLGTLTEDLLDVTRLQAGRLHLQCTPGNVTVLVQRVATLMQQTTTRHQITVHTARPTLVANIDTARLEQILTNLIGNAIKYSPQGGAIRISVAEDSVAQEVRISVQDRGIGIPAHQQGQIFGRFIRADNAVAWGISGTGLGLYLCRELVEQQGGHLWFVSEEGAGSTFFITLPLALSLQENNQA